MRFTPFFALMWPLTAQAQDFSSYHLSAEPPRHGTIGTEYFSCDDSGDDCSADVPAGAMREVTAYADEGYAFSSWGGSCSGQKSAVCTLHFTADHTVSAVFVEGSRPPDPVPTPPVPQPPQPRPPAPNLLKNPGFEAGLGDWTSWQERSTVQITGNYPHSGRNAAYISIAGGLGGFKHFFYQDVTVANGPYTAACWVRGYASSSMAVIAKDYGGRELQAAINPGSDYHLVKLDRIDVTSGHVLIAVWIDGRGRDEWLMVDDCSLQAL